jgi:flavorubredoxin
MKTSQQDGTRIDEIAEDVYRISTPIPPSAMPGGFTFNQYLVVDASPLLYHSGPRKLFPLVSAAIAAVLPVRDLRYVSFSHFEADECGALNDFLTLAPAAEPLCGKIARMTSVDDVALRPARALADGEELSLGRHTVHWIDTPHLPHAWECGHLFERSTQTLFCGDLFTQGGHDHRPLTTADILEPSEAMRARLDYFSQTRRVRELAEKLAATAPRVLACMHGAAWEGDGAGLLRELAGRLAA